MVRPLTAKPDRRICLPIMKKMEWTKLTDREQLDEIDAISADRPVLIYKHSTRCIVCHMTKRWLERELPGEDDGAYYFLDLLARRDISNAIAARYGIAHESPQVLVIRNGRCIHSASHMAIAEKEVLDGLRQA